MCFLAGDNEKGKKYTMKKLFLAIKHGDIATVRELLVDRGADLNFIENEATCCNKWRAPVVHDAINSAVISSRWNTVDSIKKDEHGNGMVKVFSTKEEADKAYGILKKMIDLGADVNAEDSYGNSGLWRFCLQAAQILPRYNYTHDYECKDRIFTAEIEEDLKRILVLLKSAGADCNTTTHNKV